MGYQKNREQIKEANEICSKMGLKIKFEQCIIKMLNTEEGTMSMIGRENEINSENSTMYQEELQIKVRNFDKGGVTMMWGLEMFEENFQKMKERYA